MRLLLDTHVVLWWCEDSPFLGDESRAAIATAAVVLVSAASAWEAAIKRALGKLRLTEAFGESVERSGFSALPITFQHADVVADLPEYHRDPFDRMLIAQARVEDLTIVTHDRRFGEYGVATLWA
ncbi:MAG: type II toxin-antitoxin system VapC family toxin [Gemmatimonadaceae bacterium]